MNGNLPEFNGVKIVSIFPRYEKHYYTSGVDITTTSYGTATATNRTSSYKTPSWEVTVQNIGSTEVDTELEFSLLDTAGVTVQKDLLLFHSLEPGEKMRQTFRPAHSYYAIKLKRMVVGGKWAAVDYTMPKQKTDYAPAVIKLAVALVILYFVLQPHFETVYHTYYPQIDVIQEAGLYSTPNGKEQQKLKPGDFLRLVDKTSGPESTHKGKKVKWYKVTRGLTAAHFWIMSTAVKVTEKHNPLVTKEKELRFRWD